MVAASGAGSAMAATRRGARRRRGAVKRILVEGA
jgi:hypothetical protein